MERSKGRRLRDARTPGICDDATRIAMLDFWLDEVGVFKRPLVMWWSGGREEAANQHLMWLITPPPSCSTTQVSCCMSTSIERLLPVCSDENTVHAMIELIRSLCGTAIFSPQSG